MRDAANTLDVAVQAIAPLAARVAYTENVRQALARLGQIELARLKRRWLSDGWTQAQVHEIIPDRPTGTPEPKG